MSQTSVTPYLMFGGRCEEALEFYQKAIDAKVEMVMKFNESPEPTPEGMLAPGFEHKVMHASFKINGATVMASDGCAPGGDFQGFQLALAVKTEAEADKAFNGLAEGGTVTMPLTPTFWSPKYGMLKDRFGIEWMVMVESPMA